MKDENQQINFTNFEFFNMDSLVPPPAPILNPQESNFVEETDGTVEEEQTNIISEEETIDIPQTIVDNTNDDSVEMMEETIDLDVRIEEPITEESSLEELPESLKYEWPVS